MTFRSGQWVILGMFGCALGAAVFGMWYRYHVTRRSLELWGAPAAVLIARAAKIEALQFDPPLPADGPFDIDTLRSKAARSENVGDSRGMLNVRQAFVEDSTFRWQQSSTSPPAWTYALVFSDGERQTAILFDPAAQTVGSPAIGNSGTGNSGTGKPVSLEPQASEELLEFFQEQFARAPIK